MKVFHPDPESPAKVDCYLEFISTTFDDFDMYYCRKHKILVYLSNKDKREHIIAMQNSQGIINDREEIIRHLITRLKVYEPNIDIDEEFCKVICAWSEKNDS